jgi:hypothetical protein
MSRTGVPACRDVRASALAPPLFERQEQGLAPLQSEYGGASKKTRAARQAGTPVLLGENSGTFLSSEWINRKRSNTKITSHADCGDCHCAAGGLCVSASTLGMPLARGLFLSRSVAGEARVTCGRGQAARWLPSYAQPARRAGEGAAQFGTIYFRIRADCQLCFLVADYVGNRHPPANEYS